MGCWNWGSTYDWILGMLTACAGVKHPPGSGQAPPCGVLGGMNSVCDLAGVYSCLMMSMIVYSSAVDLYRVQHAARPSGMMPIAVQKPSGSAHCD
jgi:hypothetical protein